MTTYLRNHLWVALSIAAAVGIAALSLLALAGNKTGFLRTSGIHSTNNGALLADSTCVVPRERND